MPLRAGAFHDTFFLISHHHIFAFTKTLRYRVSLYPEAKPGIIKPVRSTVPEISPSAILPGQAALLALEALISKSTQYYLVKSLSTYLLTIRLTVLKGASIFKKLDFEIFNYVIHITLGRSESYRVKFQLLKSDDASSVFFFFLFYVSN